MIADAVSRETWVGLNPTQATFLVKGIIGQESRFDPHAYRAEPARATFPAPWNMTGDASRGLMQVLEQTARGLGYTGDVGSDRTGTGGLYDPATSIRLGVKNLAAELRRARGNWDQAIAAYNEGGSRAAADAASGTYRNLDYVSQVLANYAYFSRGALPPSPASSATFPTSSSKGSCLGILVAGIFVGSELVWWLTR